MKKTGEILTYLRMHRKYCSTGTKKKLGGIKLLTWLKEPLKSPENRVIWAGKVAERGNLDFCSRFWSHGEDSERAPPPKQTKRKR